MCLFGGIRLSGCLLACREKKLDGRKRLHTFPHTLICLRAPAESPSSPLELKVKSFILSRKTMKRGKKNTCPSLQIFYLKRTEAGGDQCLAAASPPGGNLSFPPRRTFTVAAQWRRQAAECVRKLRQLSWHQSEGWRNKENKKRGGGPRWEATPYTCPATLEEETPVSSSDLLQPADTLMSDQQAVR